MNEVYRVRVFFLISVRSLRVVCSLLKTHNFTTFLTLRPSTMITDIQLKSFAAIDQISSLCVRMKNNTKMVYVFVCGVPHCKEIRYCKCVFVCCAFFFLFFHFGTTATTAMTAAAHDARVVRLKYGTFTTVQHTHTNVYVVRIAERMRCHFHESECVDVLRRAVAQ